MSRHVLWSASSLFAPNPVSPLPVEIKRQIIPKCARWTQEAGYDVPRYAAEVNGLQDGGPFVRSRKKTSSLPFSLHDRNLPQNSDSCLVFALLNPTAHRRILER